MGARRLYALAAAAGMRHFHFVPHPWRLSSDTSGEEARFMYRLEDYIPDRHEAYARYLLAHITPSQRWGIGRLDLDGWKMFFKGGGAPARARWTIRSRSSNGAACGSPRP